MYYEKGRMPGDLKAPGMYYEKVYSCFFMGNRGNVHSFLSGDYEK